MHFTPIIIAHIATAVGALVIGALVLTLRKGTPLHRLLGRSWAVLMLTTALLSFGIRTSGHFSWIHLLSLWILFAVSASVFAAMHGRIRAHRRGMLGAYAGLAIAALFTLLPSRLLGQLVWHATGLL